MHSNPFGITPIYVSRRNGRRVTRHIDGYVSSNGRLRIEFRHSNIDTEPVGALKLPYVVQYVTADGHAREAWCAGRDLTRIVRRRVRLNGGRVFRALYVPEPERAL